MKEVSQKVKAINNNPILEICLLVVIILTFISSCGSNQQEEPITIIESEDTELVTPIIQTPTPLIHLEDNLDEQDQLGWCIDTRGNGFNEVLHTHSCKPSGGDVQFTYNEETLQICSVEFTGFCVEMSEGVLEGASLSLVESDTESNNQKFVFNADNGEFNPEGNTNLCLAAGSVSSAAGIYMSRSLTLELSSETDESLKKWIIVTN